MSDISNKTLALLVGVAIIISVAGILVAQRGATHITGFAAYQGYANLTIMQYVEITVTGTIDFGNGTVYANSTSVDMYSDNGTVCGTTQTAQYFCRDVTAGSPLMEAGGNWTFIRQFINIENTGNVDVRVSVQSNKNSTMMIGGTSAGGPKLEYWVQEQEPGSCTSGGIVNASSYKGVNNTDDEVVCGVLDKDQTMDLLNMSIHVRVPSDADPGFKTTTFTITGQ